MLSTSCFEARASGLNFRRRPSRSSQRRFRPVTSSISPTGPATSLASSSEVAASRSPLARSIASLGEQTACPTWKPASHSG